MPWLITSQGFTKVLVVSAYLKHAHPLTFVRKCMILCCEMFLKKHFYTLISNLLLILRSSECGFCINVTSMSLSMAEKQLGTKAYIRKVIIHGVLIGMYYSYEYDFHMQIKQWQKLKINQLVHKVAPHPHGWDMEYLLWAFKNCVTWHDLTMSWNLT